MNPSIQQFETPVDLQNAPPLPEFDRARRLYAEALATQRLVLEVHARCYRRRAQDRARVASTVMHAPAALEPSVAAPVPADTSRATVEQLTPRQREVVRLISRGCTNAEIADVLVVTPGTAANHVRAILTRLGLTNRTKVAAWAVAAGLLDTA